MKKIALIIAVVGLVGLSSCSKEKSVVCKKTITNVTTTYTVTETEAEACVATICNSTSLNGTTQDAYVASLEAAGYSCE